MSTEQRTLDDCREVLATAAALGVEVRGFPGMHLYSALVMIDHEDIVVDLGVYADYPSAQRAIALWVVREMAEVGPILDTLIIEGKDEGWDDERFADWVRSCDPQILIEEYFTPDGADGWRIDDLVVAPSLPNAPITVQEAFASQV